MTVSATSSGLPSLPTGKPGLLNQYCVSTTSPEKASLTLADPRLHILVFSIAHHGRPLDHGRCHGIDGDPLPRAYASASKLSTLFHHHTHLLRHVPRQPMHNPMHRTLRTRIMRPHIPARERRNTTTPHDPTPALLLHERQTQLRQQNPRTGVDPPSPLEHFDGHVGQALHAGVPAAGAGVVEEDARVADVPDDGCVELADLREVAHVCLEETVFDRVALRCRGRDRSRELLADVVAGGVVVEG